MNTNLIVPPIYKKNISKPIIFLAGPIQGTTNWQNDAIDYIMSKSSSVLIASPRRNIDFEGEFSEQMYAEQVDWETHHLRLAGKNGVILFWLAKEHNHNCKRSYAQTTRFELAEWKVKHEVYGAKIIIGIDKGFTGARYIKRRFNQDCPDVHILSNLNAVCDAALELLKQ